MNAARRHGIEAGVIAAAVLLQILPIPQRWIETGYANGVYATLARTFVPLANAAPLTIGDVLLVAIVGGIIAAGVAMWRGPGSRMRRGGRLVLRVIALLAAIAIWFDAAWALNYRRVPIVQRVAFDRARVDALRVAAFRAAIVAALNAAAPLAHAQAESDAAMRRTLATDFAPVVRRLGDRADVIVSRPKTTVFNWWFAAAGIGGTWDPFAYETIVNADFLPFERPFAIAHEWGHVAGFGDESDANAIAAITTLRSHDPIIRYSGLFWTYGFLPPPKPGEPQVSALVRADLAAAERRFLRGYNPHLFALQWFVYDKYLRVNRVTAGVVSYSRFVELLVGTPRDAAGLPLLRPQSAPTHLSRS